MKKSVVILILIIYIASIAFVGFFGMKMLSYNEVIKPEKVEITNQDLKQTSDSEGDYKYIVLDFEETKTYTITWKVYPETASQDVEFVYDKTNTVAQVTSWGGVSFNKTGTITIIVRASGGMSTIYARVKIIAFKT